MGLFSSITDALGVTTHAQDELLKKQLKSDKIATAQQMGIDQPYVDVGRGALSDLATVYGQNAPAGPGGAPGGDLATRTASFMERFQNSPAYQTIFKNNLAESGRGIERFASANGRLNSGRTLTELGNNAGVEAGRSLDGFVSGIQGLSDRGFDAGGRQISTLGGGKDDQRQYTEGRIATANARAATVSGYVNGAISAVTGVPTSSFAPRPAPRMPPA